MPSDIGHEDPDWVGRAQLLLRARRRRAPQVRELERQADRAEPLGEAARRIVHPAILSPAAGATLPGMRFAIAIPQFYADGEFDPAAFRAYFARVEELGYHSAWTQESVLGPSPQLAPVEAMTYAAACTERLRLGCVVFVSTLYSPVHLAKSLSTLDQL